jgi:putative SOS response-associated peptidase YedK
LIPADGFYEWQVVHGRKQPMRFTLAGDEPFAFAGLWTVWNDKPTGRSSKARRSSPPAPTSSSRQCTTGRRLSCRRRQKDSGSMMRLCAAIAGAAR